MPEVCRDLCETVPSGPDGTSAAVNSEPLQLWLPVQDLHRIQPVNTLAWGEKELTWREKEMLGYGLLMTSGEGESVFCKTMVLCKSAMFQRMIPGT